MTDVGSTKAALVGAIEHPNFIGGHPLAGAEATGVAHARADLFEGATWYLTPRLATPGVLYERLARFVAGLGAVPTAIAPADHDRLMAVVSHLPHVVANLLVAQAAEALGGETLPATGPSFRDATRVAGSNPALWAQIYSANRDALGTQIDDLVRRLGEVRALLDAGDGADLAAWQEVAAQQRGALLQVGLGGRRRRRGAADLRGRAQPAGRRGRDRARAGPRRDQHHRHVARARGRQPDGHGHALARPGRGAARDRAHRRARVPGGVAAGVASVRFEPSGRLRGTVTAPPDKSISHRAALLGAMSAEPVRISNYLRAEDTLSTLEALRAVGALVEEHDDGTVVVRGSGLREAREPGGPIDVGNAGTLMRLLPGWLAAQEGRIFVLDGDSSIRRRPGRPDRRAAAPDGRRHPRHRRPLPAVRRLRHAAVGDHLRDADGERAGEVLRAARRARGGRDDERRRARAEPRPHRADAAPARASRSRATG